MNSKMNKREKKPNHYIIMCVCVCLVNFVFLLYNSLNFSKKIIMLLLILLLLLFLLLVFAIENVLLLYKPASFKSLSADHGLKFCCFC